MRQNSLICLDWCNEKAHITWASATNFISPGIVQQTNLSQLVQCKSLVNFTWSSATEESILQEANPISPRLLQQISLFPLILCNRTIRIHLTQCNIQTNLFTQTSTTNNFFFTCFCATDQPALYDSLPCLTCLSLLEPTLLTIMRPA